MGARLTGGAGGGIGFIGTSAGVTLAGAGGVAVVHQSPAGALGGAGGWSGWGAAAHQASAAGAATAAPQAGQVFVWVVPESSTEMACAHRAQVR
jgi:hypothetical protein